MSAKNGASAVPSADLTPTSKKRKLTDQVKFYAVRAGHRPGVYTNWKECEANITGFRGASFKSFTTLSDANLFVAGKNPVSTDSSPVSAQAKFYGVAKGHNPGVYTDWESAQDQIKGWKGPRYKKFATRKEAEEFVKSGGGVSNVGRPRKVESKANASSVRATADGEEEEQDFEDLPPPLKKVKAAVGKAVEKVTKTKTVEKADAKSWEGVEEVAADDDDEEEDDGEGPLKIYTDGSSLGNGQLGAIAGVGVYFGDNDPRNISTRLPGALQTNQRAELFAILRALEIAPADRSVCIYTDSRYAINCVTVWYKAWERNGWLTSLKAEVSNRDLIEGVLGRTHARNKAGGVTEYKWVKGHVGLKGNEQADRLAVNGARGGAF